MKRIYRNVIICSILCILLLCTCGIAYSAPPIPDNAFVFDIPQDMLQTDTIVIQSSYAKLAGTWAIGPIGDGHELVVCTSAPYQITCHLDNTQQLLIWYVPTGGVDTCGNPTIPIVTINNIDETRRIALYTDAVATKYCYYYPIIQNP